MCPEKTIDDSAFLDGLATQSGFARLVGVSQASIWKHVGRSLHMGETYRTWLLAYCEHLRFEAAGRSDINQARQIQTRVKDQVQNRRLYVLKKQIQQ